MDLSNSVFEVSTLQGILALCSKLQNLSLEGLQLSDPIVRCVAAEPGPAAIGFMCEGGSCVWLG